MFYMRKYTETPAKLAFNIPLSFPKGFLMDLWIHPLQYGSEYQGDLQWIANVQFWNPLYKNPEACP